MSSKTLTIILILLTGFIIYCIYSIVKIHERAIQLSKSEDVKTYMAREKKRLERAKLKMSKDEKELEDIEEIQNIANAELGSKEVDEEEMVPENLELAEELERLRKEVE